MIWTMQEPVCCMDIKAGRAPALPREGIYNQKKNANRRKVKMNTFLDDAWKDL